MSKKAKKIISIMLTMIVLAGMFCTVFAVPEIGTAPTTEKMLTARNKILGFVKWVGYAFAVGMLLYIGIKYVMASANEKADLKTGAIKYVIGAVLVAGAVTIVEFIANIGSNTTTTNN